MGLSFLRSVAATVVSLTVLFQAAGVQSQTVPGGAEAGRVDERFVQGNTPTVSPRIIRGLESTIPPSQAALIKLKLSKVIVSGSTVYSNQDFSGTYSELLGKTVSLAQVFDIAALITAKYGQDGFILSRAIIPPQELKQSGATIHILIIEGYIDEVRWPKKTATGRRLLDGYAKRISADRPLNVKTLERYLLLANDVPGSSFKSNLVASSVNPGASTLIVTVEEDQASGYVSVDNHGVEASGPFQVTFGGELNNYFGLNERIKVDATIAGPSSANGLELYYLALGYSQVLNAEGLTLFVDGNVSRGSPGTAALTALNYQTEGLNVSAGVRYSFVKTRERSLVGTLAFDARNSRSFSLGVPATEDRLRIVRGELAFQKADDKGGQNQATLAFSHGFEGLGSTANGNALASRTPGVVDFTKLTVDLARTQQLKNGFSLYGHMFGQWSNDPLLSSQECGFGGRTFGTGFDSSVITGDTCFMASLELRKNMNVPDSMTNWLNFAQSFAVVDYGKIWNTSAPLGTPENDYGTSAGLGVRFGNDGFSTELGLTTTLSKPGSQSTVDTARGWLKVTKRF